MKKDHPDSGLNFLQRLWMTCDHATYLLSMEDYGRLPLISRIHLRIHLLTCDACSAFKKQWEYLTRTIRKRKDLQSMQEFNFPPSLAAEIQKDIDKKIQNEKK